MSPENQELVFAAVNLTAEILQGKLRPLSNRPIRNPHAHVWAVINSVFDVESYKDIPDSRYSDVLLLLAIMSSQVPVVKLDSLDS